jgi:Uma2 family endonuclease
MPLSFMQLGEMAAEIGVRLEIINGVPVWEMMPAARHQQESFRIQSSIEKTSPDCACVHYADVLVQFADSSYKRPDIAIFCRVPDELDEAITLLPEAVVEIISVGYEKKDTELAPKFYLEHGIPDILIFDPRSLQIWHHTPAGVNQYTSPRVFELACGCTVQV